MGRELLHCSVGVWVHRKASGVALVSDYGLWWGFKGKSMINEAKWDESIFMYLVQSSIIIMALIGQKYAPCYGHSDVFPSNATPRERFSLTAYGP